MLEDEDYHGEPASEQASQNDPQIEGRDLVAFELQTGHGIVIAPARTRRSWMDATQNRFANRCLPLLMANQAGWELSASHDVSIHWGGGIDRADMKFEFYGGPPPYPVSSHFGHGIVTWTIPYLFRLPQGWNLLVRGPANEIRDGLAPLEGLVEADWTPSTFTMNWIFTRPRVTTTFRAGEPFCLIIPQRRGELETFEPRFASAPPTGDEYDRYKAWRDSRRSFIEDLRQPWRKARASGWQKHYSQGITEDGAKFEAHQKRLHLRPVRPEKPDKQLEVPTAPTPNLP